MPNNLLLKPVITEKSITLAQTGQFSFLVRKESTKETIKKATEDLFKVKVIKVRLQTKPGKTKRSGKKRLPSKIKSFKKALVTLEKGQSIDYFKLPDEKGKSKKTKTVKKPVVKPTPKTQPTKKGFLGLGKRKEQRTQDK